MGKAKVAQSYASAGRGGSWTPGIVPSSGVLGHPRSCPLGLAAGLCRRVPGRSCLRLCSRGGRGHLPCFLQAELPWKRALHLTLCDLVTLHKVFVQLGLDYHGAGRAAEPGPGAGGSANLRLSRSEALPLSLLWLLCRQESPVIGPPPGQCYCPHHGAGFTQLSSPRAGKFPSWSWWPLMARPPLVVICCL